MKQYYADVIVDISANRLDRSFQYRIPEDLASFVQEGSKVRVPFGRGSRLVDGFVLSVSETPKIDESLLKEIAACPDNYITVEERLVKLAAWIRRNYGSTFLQALKTVLPVKEKRRRAVKKTEAADGSRTGPALPAVPALNPEQQETYEGIRAEFAKDEPRPCLLRGITGSGKTHIYMKLIEEEIQKGRAAILLIPEISLTWQTVSRFTACFGEKVAVLHSRLSKGERADLVEKVKKHEVMLVIGPRSALFTPFDDLGLIIVDEEQDASYQSEKMPRYHARETAVERARIEGAKILFGSATPSLESRYLCETCDYALFELNERFAGAQMPQIRIIDMRQEPAKGQRSVLSRELEEEIADRLDKGEQSILFLNRRGYTGFITCRSCGSVIKCPHCDVSLTYHKTGQLICHYCGHTKPMVQVCPSCGSPYIGGFKTGTQQVEEVIRKRFPQARILRMDKDTTGKKNSYEEILKCFASGGADILIGTQMIVKGHDFPKVTLAGVLAADISLYAGDYRAAEKTFQLLVQTVGRAGRGELGGLGIIQTWNPEHYAVQAAVSQDYEAFYAEEIGIREIMHYPPACALLKIHGSGPDEERLMNAMRHIKKYLTDIRGDERIALLGPVADPVSRLKDQYRIVVYVKNAGLQQIIRLRQYTEKYIAINSGFDEISVQFALNE